MDFEEFQSEIEDKADFEKAIIAIQSDLVNAQKLFQQTSDMLHALNKGGYINPSYHDLFANIKTELSDVANRNFDDPKVREEVIAQLFQIHEAVAEFNNTISAESDHLLNSQDIKQILNSDHLQKSINELRDEIERNMNMDLNNNNNQRAEEFFKLLVSAQAQSVSALNLSLESAVELKGSQKTVELFKIYQDIKGVNEKINELKTKQMDEKTSDKQSQYEKEVLQNRSKIRAHAEGRDQKKIMMLIAQAGHQNENVASEINALREKISQIENKLASLQKKLNQTSASDERILLKKSLTNKIKNMTDSVNKLKTQFDNQSEKSKILSLYNKHALLMVHEDSINKIDNSINNIVEAEASKKDQHSAEPEWNDWDEEESDEEIEEDELSNESESEEEVENEDEEEVENEIEENKTPEKKDEWDEWEWSEEEDSEEDSSSKPKGPGMS